jgi:hypothetical protein
MKKSTKKKLYVIGVIVGIILILVILGVLSGSIKFKTTTHQQSQSTDGDNINITDDANNVAQAGQLTVRNCIDQCPVGKATKVNQNWKNLSGCCVRGTCPKGGKRVIKSQGKPRVCASMMPHISTEKLKQHLSKSMSPSRVGKMNAIKARAAFQKSLLWPIGKKLRISFLKDKHLRNSGYDSKKAKFVQNIIMTKLAPHVPGLSFEWDVVPEMNADIRITFNSDWGAYSVIGRGNSGSPETMNLGWLDDDRDADFPEAKGQGTVVIHEFGHALGMIHEHTRQDAALPWNCKEIYDELSGPPNNWDKATINSNVFEPTSMSQLFASKYDPKSIMHYYFPPQFFSEPVNLPQNVRLSCLDVCLLRRMYPKTGPRLIEGTNL